MLEKGKQLMPKEMRRKAVIEMTGHIAKNNSSKKAC